MNWRWIKAKMTLGFALIRHVILGPLARRNNADGWLAAIAQESLTSTPPDTWENLRGANDCIGCGLCDSIAAESSASRMILGSARRPEDSLLAVSDVPTLQRIARDVSRICPARVDTNQIAQLISDHAAKLKR